MLKLNVTDGRTDGQMDGRTDGGRCNISRPGPSAAREITNSFHIWPTMGKNAQFWLFRGPK